MRFRGDQISHNQIISRLWGGAGVKSQRTQCAPFLAVRRCSAATQRNKPPRSGAVLLGRASALIKSRRAAATFPRREPFTGSANKRASATAADRRGAGGRQAYAKPRRWRGKGGQQGKKWDAGAS